MNRFFIYCNTNQAYEALTYNDIICSELKRDLFRVATVSFLADSFIFLSAEKLSKESRLFGIAEQDNQYPVTFEIAIPEDYDLAAHLVIRNDIGSYNVAEKLLPISELAQTDDCIGAFVYGHIPFSFVKGVIFENAENRDRFFKSGSELWFPEEMFSTWEEEPYSSIPQRTIKPDALRNAANTISAQLDPAQKEELDTILQKQIHAKTVGYLAVEATKNWQIGNIRTNIDSYIIKLLDPGGEKLKTVAEEKLSLLNDLFPFVDYNSFEQIDSALEDATSKDNVLLCAILNAIADSNYSISKETVGVLNDQLKAEAMGINFFQASDLIEGMDAINTFINSRIGDSDEMLEAVKGNAVLYALAICVKNKGKIENVRSETADMTQTVRRYAYIISGMTASMADISGNVKCNMELEDNLSDVCSLGYSDNNCMLIKPKTAARDVFGISPQIYINVNADTFKTNIYEAETERLNNLYRVEFAALVPEKEVSCFRNPVRVVIDGSEFIVDSPDKAEEVKKAIDKKISKRKLEFSKEMFLHKVIENERWKDTLNDIFRKYKGQKR